MSRPRLSDKKLSDKKTVERYNTDFGFVLVERHEDGDYEIECYGMTGYGRYEMFVSCSFGPEDDFDSSYGLLVDDEPEIDVYLSTKERLGS